MTLIALHALHIVFMAFWFGSFMWTEAILWPRMRATGQLEPVQTALRNVRGRQMMGVAVVGTIITGFLRGVAGGVFDNIYSPYGVLFCASGLVGFWMVTWWLSFPPRSHKIGWLMFYSSFWVIVALMIGMRFTHPSGA